MNGTRQGYSGWVEGEGVLGGQRVMEEGCQAVWEALCPAGLGGRGPSLAVELGEGWASCPGCEVQAGAADSLSGTEPWASQMELSSVRFFQIRTGVVFLRRPILSALPLTSQALAPCRLPAPCPCPPRPSPCGELCHGAPGPFLERPLPGHMPTTALPGPPLCRPAPLLPGPAQACLWELH